MSKLDSIISRTSYQQYVAPALHFSYWRHRFLGGVIGTLSLRVASVILSFVTSLVLARLLGPAGYGAYAYSLGWVSLLVVLVLFGTDKLMTRQASAYETQSQWGLLAGLMRWSSGIVLAASLATSMLMLLIVQLFFKHLELLTVTTLTVSFALLPLLALGRLWQSALVGLKYVVSGQVPDIIIRPFFFLLGIGGMYLWTTGLTPVATIWLQVGASLLALLMVGYLLRVVQPVHLRQAGQEYEQKLWLTASLPIFLSAMLEVVNTRADIIMLGTLGSADAVGIYNVAKRLAEPLLFVLIAVNMTLAPRIASLHVQGDTRALQQLVTKTARLAFLAALLIGGCLIGFSEWLLALWGEPFLVGQMAFIILAISQIINVMTGSVALLLLMTGHEKSVALAIGFATVVNVGLNYLLIPVWGINGTAVATAMGTVLANILLAFAVHKKLRLNPTAFGKLI